MAYDEQKLGVELTGARVALLQERGSQSSDEEEGVAVKGGPMTGALSNFEHNPGTYRCDTGRCALAFGAAAVAGFMIWMIATSPSI